MGKVFSIIIMVISLTLAVAPAGLVSWICGDCPDETVWIWGHQYTDESMVYKEMVLIKIEAGHFEDERNFMTQSEHSAFINR